MYKKKIKVRITGNTSDNLDIINQTNQLVKNIELYLKTFIGLDTSIKAEVVFKNISRSGKSKQNKTSDLKKEGEYERIVPRI